MQLLNLMIEKARSLDTACTLASQQASSSGGLPLVSKSSSSLSMVPLEDAVDDKALGEGKTHADKQPEGDHED